MASTRPPLTIAFIGDSLTQGVGDETGLGWVGRLANQINETYELTWYNLGVRGDTTLELSRRAPDELRVRVAPVGDTWVVLCIGTNDSSLCDGVPRIPLERSLKLIERTLDGIVPLAKVLWISPVPVAQERLEIEFQGMTFSFPTERVKALSDGFAKIAQRRGIPYLDLVEELSALNFAAHETDDGIHPKSPGYKALLELISDWARDQLSAP